MELVYGWQIKEKYAINVKFTDVRIELWSWKSVLYSWETHSEVFGGKEIRHL